MVILNVMRHAVTLRRFGTACRKSLTRLLSGKYVVPDAPSLGQVLNDKIIKEYLAYTIK